ncbi:dCTP deaminase domain-containing protein [Shimia sp. Alg240-R146]|uniref:dCTP deaminase domain-containing protein n=1 Tax=Shimia sp. Alg240-R146 TaxID=2993449 RepID=UPI0022E3A90E|nr:hypothetical protein [Shimia sp. Alg240-R146]
MLIVREKITELGLVAPKDQIKLKNSTLDLTVGQIFPMGEDREAGARGLNQFILQPSHMVTVLSSQRLTLPSDVTGLATLVTSLTQEGILCLNTGIVDPGYDGHLSATLVNFSAIPRRISLDDRLFRVIFLPHRELRGEEFEPFRSLKQDYASRIDNQANQEFSETFLNVKGILKIARGQAWRVVWASMLTNWMPIFALLAGLAGALFGGLAYFGSG